MSAGKWIHRRFWGLAVGTVVTALVVLMYLGGMWSWLDHQFLDFIFRRVNRIEADPRIVMIDINDAALKRIERWPWPRRMQAELVGVLHECGAAAILLDLVYSEPSPARIVHPSLEPYHEMEPGAEPLGQPAMSDVVRDDDELAAAIREAGNAYVAMFFPLSDPDRDIIKRRVRARGLIDGQPDISLEDFAQQIKAFPGESIEELYQRTRIDRLLRQDFSLGVGELATRLGIGPDQVERWISDNKELAARALVAKYIRDNPQAEFGDVYRHLLPNQPADVETPDRHELIRAYDHALAAREAFKHQLPRAARFVGVIPNGADATLPISKIAAAARRVGYVNFEKDTDGVLRHIPVLANVDGHVMMQIAFALACDALDIDRNSIDVVGRRTLRMHNRAGDQEWLLPLNARGEMLLNWNINRENPIWSGSFVHKPVARLMEVAFNRRAVRENRAGLHVRIAEAVELMYQGAESAYLDYEAAVRRFNELTDHRYDQGAHDAEAEQLRARIEADEQKALANLNRLANEIQGLEPQDDFERDLFAKVNHLKKDLLTGAYADEIARLNAALEQRNKALLAELHADLNGKFCFVGHTAAAQADMVNAPIFENMPGVMAHANMVNTLLNNQVPTIVSPLLHAVLIVLTGLLVTALTSSKGPWVTFISVLLLMIVLSATSMVLIMATSQYLAGVIPAAGIFVIWALITLYRQLTEERQRRSFARELSRNTSPAIAAQISEELDEAELVPRPAEVTCYFSDLQGFTSISERLGVEQTKTILNQYLGAMGEVLIRFKAFNKFMGDGIFAFFNAPILPQLDHQVVGCEAALATAERLEELKGGGDGEYGAEFANLRMRVGLHAGPVFVGYFGSENQTDYTCIGDTVNLAARLEPANKVFGTQIIVSGACHDVAGTRYAYRHLGALQVKGKAKAEPVYELLGRTGQIAEGLLTYAKRFAEAVDHFQNRRWAEARKAFDSCKQQRPEDAAVALYLAEIERLESTAPPQDWNKAIELTTK